MEKSTATIRTMMGKKNVAIALRCLGSVKAFTRRPLRFVVHDDGTLDDEDRALLVEKLAPCDFQSRDAHGGRVEELLARYPRCGKFRNTNLFGLKLFDVPLLSTDRAIYLDTDILFTRPLDIPAYFEGTPEAAFVCMEDIAESYAPTIRMWPGLQGDGIVFTSRVCAGMISLAASGLDLEFIEWFLGRDEEKNYLGVYPFWAEQTIYAALAARGQCVYIDPRECRIAHARTLPKDFTPAILHFAGFQRPLLEKVFPEVDFSDTRPPLILKTSAAPHCTLSRRVYSALKKRFWL